MFKKSKVKKNRKGKKCHWRERFVYDLVNIIVENEKYRKKLLLTNLKNAKNGHYMESAVDVQNIAKIFHMTLTKLGKIFVVLLRDVGELPLKQRQTQVSKAFMKTKIMDNGATD